MMPDIIITTTDFSSSIIPGDLVIIYGGINDGIYTIRSINSKSITLITDDHLIGEASTTYTIAFIRINRREIVSERFAKLTFVDSTHLITDSDSLINFEELGVADGDIAIISSATESGNRYAFAIASVSEYTFTLNSVDKVIDDTADPCIIKIVRPTVGYQWDNENWKLMLPSYVKKVFKIYENNNELNNRGYEYINTNSDKPVYTMVTRQIIQLASEIMDTVDDELKLKIFKEYEPLTDKTSGTKINIPQQYRGILQSGVMSYILAKPKYRNPVLFEQNKYRYALGLSEIKKQEAVRLPGIKR